MTLSLTTVLRGLLDREPTDHELELVRRAALRIESPDRMAVAVVMTRAEAAQVAGVLRAAGRIALADRVRGDA